MPILTLTSDIGLQDFMPAAIKGQILQSNPSFQIIDVTHQLSPFNFPQAAYICRCTLNAFPPESFHLILVNLFNEKPKHLLLAEHNNRYIGCADNGLLTMILQEIPENVVAIPLDDKKTRNTFECVKVLVEAFNEVLAGRDLYKIGNPSIDINVKNPYKPMIGKDWMEAQILFVDNFENVVVNITKEDFEEQRKGRNFKISFRRDEIIDKISETYADVPEGEKLAIFNSAGYLEIAINKGNAAGLFGLQGFSESQDAYMKGTHFSSNLSYQMVKIYFDQ